MEVYFNSIFFSFFAGVVGYLVGTSFYSFMFGVAVGMGVVIVNTSLIKSGIIDDV